MHYLSSNVRKDTLCVFLLFVCVRDISLVSIRFFIAVRFRFICPVFGVFSVLAYLIFSMPVRGFVLFVQFARLLRFLQVVRPVRFAQIVRVFRCRFVLYRCRRSFKFLGFLGEFLPCLFTSCFFTSKNLVEKLA